MANIKESFTAIYQKHRGLLVLMLVLFIASIVLIITSFLSISFNKPTVNIGYSDISGYQAGGWVNLLAFPILALVWGIFHNFIALRLFEKRGAGWAVTFIVFTILLVLSAFIVLARLTGEG